MQENVDFSDFGNHFLDSMLDFHMEEDNNELNVIENSDIVQNASTGAGSFSQSTNIVSKLPSNVVQSVPADHLINPMHFLSVDYNPPIATSTPKSTAEKKIITMKPLKTITPRKPSGQILSEGSVKVQQDANLSNFYHKKVFKAEFKKVFDTVDSPLVPSPEVSADEMRFYKESFVDVSTVRFFKLHCTICNAHLGCSTSAAQNIKIHKIIRVLLCKRCFVFYGDGNFPKDQGDGCEIYCRWCGQGGVLICCSFCPKVFCKKCLRKNLGAIVVKQIEASKDWACVCCAIKPLWPLRCLSWALDQYVKTNVKNKVMVEDNSQCCNKLQTLLPNPKSQKKGQKKLVDIRPGVVNISSTASSNKKLINSNTAPPLVAIGDTTPQHVMIAGSIKNLGKPAIKNNYSNSSPVNGSTSVSNTPRLPIPKSLSLTPFQISSTTIQRVGVKPIQQRPSIRSIAPVRSITQLPVQSQITAFNSAKSNTNASNLIKVNVPPEIDTPGIVLRLSLPNMDSQLVHLVPNSTKPSKSNCVVPEFKNNVEQDFVGNALLDSFNLCKMVYDRLMILKENYDTNCVSNQKEVEKKRRNITKKLHFIIPKACELFGQIDGTLKQHFDRWEADLEKATEIDVIDLSDEEDANTFKGIEQTSLVKYQAPTSVFKKSNGAAIVDPFQDVQEDSKDGSGSSNTQDANKNESDVQQFRAVTIKRRVTPSQNCTVVKDDVKKGVADNSGNKKKKNEAEKEEQESKEVEVIETKKDDGNDPLAFGGNEDNEKVEEKEGESTNVVEEGNSNATTVSDTEDATEPDKIKLKRCSVKLTRIDPTTDKESNWEDAATDVDESNDSTDSIPPKRIKLERTDRSEMIIHIKHETVEKV